MNTIWKMSEEEKNRRKSARPEEVNSEWSMVNEVSPQDGKTESPKEIKNP